MQGSEEGPFGVVLTGNSEKGSAKCAGQFLISVQLTYILPLASTGRRCASRSSIIDWMGENYQRRSIIPSLEARVETATTGERQEQRLRSQDRGSAQQIEDRMVE